MAGSISRRVVLGGGVALGAAAALTRGQPAGAQAAGPMKRAYGPARVGATFDLFPFQPAITTYPAAVADWNKTTGTSMKCWKVYYQESKFPATLDARLKTIISGSIQALVSFKPTPDINSPQGREDRSRLEDAVALLRESKLQAEVCLWQEIGPRHMKPQQYKNLVEFYAPVIHRHQYPLVFDAPGYQGLPEWKAYKPDDSLLNGYAIDFYCGDFINHGVTLDQFFPLAGDKPVGVWEIGNTASSKFTPSATDVRKYMKHIRTRLTARLHSGLPVGSVAWYNGPADASQNGGNEIAGTHPCQLAPVDIGTYRELYAAVNGKYPATSPA